MLLSVAWTPRFLTCVSLILKERLQTLWRIAHQEHNREGDEAKRAVKGSSQLRLMAMLDEHRDEVFSAGKLQPYWLFKFVKYAQPGEPGPTNTPASLVLRACDAFADRPALAVPDASVITTLARRLPGRPVR